MLILFLVLLIVLFVLGVPIGFSMLVSSSVFLHSESFDMLVIPQYMYDGIDIFSLLAVPGFIFLGELMSRCGMTERLTGLAMNIIGHIRGGLGHVTVMAGMLMAGISGSAVADSAALGSVLVPFMKKMDILQNSLQLSLPLRGHSAPLSRLVLAWLFSDPWPISLLVGYF